MYQMLLMIVKKYILNFSDLVGQISAKQNPQKKTYLFHFGEQLLVIGFLDIFI